MNQCGTNECIHCLCGVPEDADATVENIAEDEDWIPYFICEACMEGEFFYISQKTGLRRVEGWNYNLVAAKRRTKTGELYLF